MTRCIESKVGHSARDKRLPELLTRISGEAYQLFASAEVNIT